MEIILFGAGRRLQTLKDQIAKYGYRAIAIFDNDDKKHGRSVKIGQEEIAVDSPENLIKYENSVPILLSVDDSIIQCDMAEKLECMGIPRSRIYIWEENHAERIPKILDVAEESGSPRVLYTVTRLTQVDDKAGIHRFMNGIYAHWPKADDVDLVPIRWFGQIVSSHRYECRCRNEYFDGIENIIRISSSDKLLISEITLGDIKQMIDAAHSSGAEACVVIHDILAATHPELFLDDWPKHFLRWLNIVLSGSSKILCVSRTVADELKEYCRQNHPCREKELPVYCFHHGFNLLDVHGSVRERIQEFVCKGVTFLIVGTVEVRKNHLLALHAFQKLKHDAIAKDIQLLILGKDGWKNQEFKETLSSDPWLSQHVLWIQDATDAELQWTYRNATALLFPSMGEGFGLPIVEAASFGLPILCSDIPIFHEVAGDGAAYFAVNDADAMSHKILEWIKADNHPDSRTIRLNSWKDCAQEILDILVGRTEPYCLIQ